MSSKQESSAKKEIPPLRHSTRRRRSQTTPQTKATAAGDGDEENPHRRTKRDGRRESNQAIHLEFCPFLSPFSFLFVSLYLSISPLLPCRATSLGPDRVDVHASVVLDYVPAGMVAHSDALLTPDEWAYPHPPPTPSPPPPHLALYLLPSFILSLSLPLSQPFLIWLYFARDSFSFFLLFINLSQSALSFSFFFRFLYDTRKSFFPKNLTTPWIPQR